MALIRRGFFLIVFPTFLMAQEQAVILVKESSLSLQGAKEVASRMEEASKKLNKTISLAVVVSPYGYSTYRGN